MPNSPGMTWLPIYVQLEILVVVEETSAAFEDGEVRVVALGEHVDVISVCQLCLHLNHLATHFGLAYCMDVRPVS